MNMWLILNGYWNRERAVWISSPNSVRFCLLRWMNSAVDKIKVDTPDWPLACSLGAAVCLKKRDDQLRRTTGDLHTPAAKCTEVDGGILEHLLWTATDLLFKHWIKIKINLTVISLSLLLLTVFCVCRFKQRFLGDHSELHTCSCHLFSSQWPILSHPKLFTFPTESPCIKASYSMDFENSCPRGKSAGA